MSDSDKLTMDALVERVERGVRDEIESPSGWWSDTATLVSSLSNLNVPGHYDTILEVYSSDNTLFTDSPDYGKGSVGAIMRYAIYERLKDAGHAEIERIEEALLEYTESLV